MSLVDYQECRADNNGVYPPRLRRVTCYSKEQCPNNGRVTAIGTVPTEGRTCGARKEDLGKTAIIYRCNEDGSIGEIIGFFIIEDTGSHARLKEGSVDVYRDSLSACYEWVGEYGDYCYVQIVEGAEG